MTAPVTVREFPLEEEYAKKTGITREDILKFREWLDTQPHLPGDLISELDLILTFHCCDRSSAVSRQVLDLHYTLKTLFTSFFKDRHVDNRVVNAAKVVSRQVLDLHHTLKTPFTSFFKECYVDGRVLNAARVILAAPLDMRTEQGYACFYVRLVDADVKKFVFADALRLALMMLDLWQVECGTWPGLVIAIDLETVTLGHLARLDLQSVQQFLYYLQEAMLVNLKSVHFLNAPSFMDKIMMLIRPFMKKALLDILVIHQVGSKTLEKYIPKDALPKEKGGQFKSYIEARDDVIRRLKLNEEFFALESRKRVVEAQRPGKPKTISDIFGSVEGSFKKLEID